jgi:tetratricopeptide (TPR) repeat protein
MPEQTIPSIQAEPPFDPTSDYTDYGPGSPNPAPLLCASIVVLLAIVITWTLGRRQHAKTAQPIDPTVTVEKQPPEAAPKPATRRQVTQWLAEGKTLENNQQLTEAVALYDQALQQYPNYSKLWHERGLAQAKLQQFDAALESYDRAYALNPKQSDLAHERGDTLLELKRYEEAIASFDLYLRYVPKSMHILTDRAYALMCLDRHEEALKSFNQVLDRHGEIGEETSIRHAHYLQIKALSNLGRIEEALQSIEVAIQRYGSSYQDSFIALRDAIHSHLATHHPE